MSPRLPALSDDQLPAASRPTLQAVGKTLGMVPNLHRTLAAAPAALHAYTGMAGALAGGELPAADRERLALVTAGRNGCDYCAAAHTVLGQGAGLTADETRENLAGRAADPRSTALLTFAGALLETQGRVSDNQLAAVRQAGLDDAQILETVAHVAMNVLTNTVNSLARTDVDFPAVELPDTCGATS